MTTIPLVLLTAAWLAASSQQGSLPSPSAATAQPDAPGLQGTVWTAVAVGERTPADPGTGKTARIVFNPGGGVTGSDGCNTLRGSYTADAAFLQIEALMGTLVACPALDRFDREFREALLRARQWRIQGRELTLLDEKGTVLARLEAQSD